MPNGTLARYICKNPAHKRRLAQTSEKKKKDLEPRRQPIRRTRALRLRERQRGLGKISPTSGLDV
ncbi:hypothetical protein BCR44DRAFT_1443049, partial [Catenaria anguillulae PL171]